ncbi:T9SS C-terminal target domain-containing protein, partial [Mariniphaga sediminis]
VAINTDLSWTADSSAVSHDVYFGASNPPAFVRNQAGTSYAPGILSNSTTYYWRIDEKNTSGTTEGVVWSFTTESGSGGAISNLALFKPVTYSSQENDSSRAASNVVDSIDNDGALRWSASPMPQWVEVDLGQDYLLSKTELVCYLDRAYQFNVEVKADGDSTYTQVVDRLSNMQPGSAANPITDTFDEAIGRYVRLTVTGAAVYTGTWASILEFRVFGRDNPYPGQAANPSPSNDSTGVAINTDLSWTADSSAVSHDVYFGASNPPAFVRNQAGTSYAPGILSNSTTYYWRIDEKNAAGTTEGVVWSFTTESGSGGAISNLALFKPVTYSSQENDSSRAASNVVDSIDNDGALRWSASPMPQWVEVDLGQDYLLSKTELVCYLDRAYQFNVEVKADGDSTYTQVVDRLSNMQPGSAANPITDTFDEAIGRYVRLTVTGAAVYTGTWASILEFRVFGRDNPYPGQAANPSPSNDSTGVAINTDLSWTADSSAVSHDVYFGTSNPPAFVQNQAGTSYAPGILSNSTTYYWRIDEKNAAGTTEGTLWHFTTADSSEVTNLALYKTVTFSDEATGNEASYVVDGIADNSALRWSASPMPQWVEVDLGKDYLLSKTELVCHLDRAYQFKVEVKTDGDTTYTQVVDRLDNTQPGTFANPITDTFSEVTGRYVRLTVTDAAVYEGDWCSILEFRVFGRDELKSISISLGTGEIIHSNFTVKNYPNPFDEFTHIQFDIPEEGHVVVKIYNINGRELAEIANSTYQPGSYTIVWNARDYKGNEVPSGLFFYKIQFNDKIKTGKMVLVE